MQILYFVTLQRSNAFNFDATYLPASRGALRVTLSLDLPRVYLDAWFPTSSTSVTQHSQSGNALKLFFIACYQRRTVTDCRCCNPEIICADEAAASFEVSSDCCIGQRYRLVIFRKLKLPLYGKKSRVIEIRKTSCKFTQCRY